ncbi:MAG: peptidoglycan editing factor PgeF, partial [Paludibacteraceae bacterium]|nr:peptidoglycan editing factor PgeF [Paludibacteraceae bacterium]
MKYKIFKPYEDRMIAFSTTREGYFKNNTESVSEGQYGRLNLCHYVGDNPEHVRINRQLFCQYHNIEPNNLFIPRQTHTNNVKCVSETDDFEETDGLISDIKGSCIGINTADCLPVLIYDPTHHAAATLHAGWRGLVGRIATKGIAMMKEKYGSNPSELLCAVGPAISTEIYEVGDELKPQFADAGFPIEEIFIDRTDWAKSHLDLKAAIKYELLDNGIAEQNIEISDICTFRNSDMFFSARKLGINSGRIFSG